MTDPARDDDSALLAAARRGERVAFGALYRRYVRFVQAIVLARVAPDAADDVVQDVFVQAMSKVGQLRDDAAFPAWLATLARHRAADWRRRRRDTVPLEHPDAQTQAAPPADDSSDARAAVEVIRALPEAYRETLLLRFVSGLTGPEIAARTGLTHGSVRVNLHRGMTMLRERLARGMRHE